MKASGSVQSQDGEGKVGARARGPRPKLLVREGDPCTFTVAAGLPDNPRMVNLPEKRVQMLLCSVCLCAAGLMSPDALFSAQPPEAEKVHFDSGEACERPSDGAAIVPPHNARSKHGLLRVALTIRSSSNGSHSLRYCYFDQLGHQAPTLRVQPGDVLDVFLKNEISLPAQTNPSAGTPKGD